MPCTKYRGRFETEKSIEVVNKLIKAQELPGRRGVKYRTIFFRAVIGSRKDILNQK